MWTYFDNQNIMNKLKGKYFEKLLNIFYVLNVLHFLNPPPPRYTKKNIIKTFLKA